MLKATGITKRFGRTVALDAVDFAAGLGEIHAIVGENGAGKSTLINILAGRLQPDRGDVVLPEHSGQSGGRSVAAVFQSPMLFERLPWEENLALGGWSGRPLRLDLAEVAARAQSLAHELGFALPPSGMRVSDCSIGDRVRLEIVRALSFDPRVLILDEPTSVLSPAELEGFFGLIRRLRAAGRAVVLVTHKLAEALALADRITVLRGGRKIADLLPAETNSRELARLMIGELAAPRAVPAGRAAGAVVLALEDLTLERDGRCIIDHVTLQVFQGEIVGIAGVDGNGQAELAAIIAGALRPSRGAVHPGNDGVVVVIPQNRDQDGLILAMSLWENLLLTAPLRHRIAGRAGWLRRRPARQFCDELITHFRIRTTGPSAPAAALSGGNRQRLLIARTLAADPRVIVAHDVCRGLDPRAVAEFHQQLREYAAAGGAVLLISNDLDEILALCGRIHVISRGALHPVASADCDPARLGLLMSGVTR